MIKIFISHAASDEGLASALVNCIYACMILEDEEVRCTSVTGHKLPIGGDTATILRDELANSAVVIGLITRNAIISSWVLFELGATWGAKKKIQPLIANDTDFKDLPGPLVNNHACKLSSKDDLMQFIDELAKAISAKLRTTPKRNSAIDALIKFNKNYSQNTTSSFNVLSKIKEPVISGMPYSELVKVLENELLIIPSEITKEKKEREMTLFNAFVSNYEIVSDGVQSNWDNDTVGGYYYRNIALKLLPYDLVKFEKLPAAQAKWFKRLVLSGNGQKFISHYKRIKTQEL